MQLWNYKDFKIFTLSPTYYLGTTYVMYPVYGSWDIVFTSWDILKNSQNKGSFDATCKIWEV